MSQYTETIGSMLNSILEKSYDAEKGYKTASEHAKHTELKSFFERKSQERYNFGHEIKREIKQLGEDVDKGGSLSGTLHRAWIDAKATFTSDNDEAMLEESIRSEKAAIDEYQSALEHKALPVSTASILTKQKNTIQADLDKIKFLEDLT